MAHASRSRLNCAKNEEEDEDDEKDDDGDDGDDDVSQTEIISLLFTSLVSSWRRLKGEKERDEIEGRIEWHHLPSSHLRANEQNICGQNSALEGGTGDGRRGGNIRRSKLRAMRAIEPFCILYSESVLALDGFARETSISKKLTRYFVIREDAPAHS